MGYPLTDITIYYEGNTLEIPPISWEFRSKLNFIADYYHDRLNGYKPQKTRRICVRFLDNEYNKDASHFGSICSCSTRIDANLYLSLADGHKNKYILDLLHNAVMDLATLYSWDKKWFEYSYNHIMESEFVFKKYYPSKKSRNRKYSACVMLEKTEAYSTLRVLVTGEKRVDRIILEKKNWWWYDSVYAVAKHSKWLNGDSFGINNNGKICYLSISDEEAVSNLVFLSDNF